MLTKVEVSKYSLTWRNFYSSSTLDHSLLVAWSKSTSSVLSSSSSVSLTSAYGLYSPTKTRFFSIKRAIYALPRMTIHLPMAITMFISPITVCKSLGITMEHMKKEILLDLKLFRSILINSFLS